MVTVAQLAEHWIVAPVVVGSSPISHPNSLHSSPLALWRFFTLSLPYR